MQKMARFAGVGLVHAEAVGLDLSKRLIHIKDGRPPIRYDVLSIDIGSTPKFVESKVRGGDQAGGRVGGLEGWEDGPNKGSIHVCFVIPTLNFSIVDIYVLRVVCVAKALTASTLVKECMNGF